MDEYHETLGKIGSYILASDDQIRGSRKFEVEGDQFKGYQINRGNTVIDIVSPRSSQYINVESSVTLDGIFRNVVDRESLDEIKADIQGNVGQDIEDGEAVDIHLRKNLCSLDDEDTATSLSEFKSDIDDSDVRIDWLTYQDTDLFNGFIVYTRLFPSSLSINSYDSAVNSIRHYAPKISKRSIDEFGEFIEEVNNKGGDIPTEGSTGEQSGPRGSGRGFA